jgi:CHAT domain-containing protein
VRVGASARADRFLDEAGSYRIVHIAAHGVLDDASPMQSRLVLPPPAGGASGSGDVAAADLMNLTLRPDLVVLSGCDTARGRIGDGEGLIGLSWALFVAGAPSLVVSQWSVTSESTSALMREFHGRLKASLKTSGRVEHRAAALRAAALSLLANPSYRHPFYWAAFVVMGDGS